MSETNMLLQRGALLLRTARFMTLATVSNAGHSWASTVNYVPLIEAPLRLTWYSMREAHHSRNITSHPQVAGSIFRTDLSLSSPLGLDGIQFNGICREVLEPDEVTYFNKHYYKFNFPEEQVRRQWMLPTEEFFGHGRRRFYELTIEDWWLLDIDQWLVDKCDQRVVMPVPSSFAKLLADVDGAVS